MQLAPDLTIDETQQAPESAPLPLAVCWAIWIGAALALWLVFLRAAAFLF